jgi:hypothetical protein
MEPSVPAPPSSEGLGDSRRLDVCSGRSLPFPRRSTQGVAAAVASLLLLACDKLPSLSKQSGELFGEFGEIPADNPPLGAVADVAFVHATPSRSSQKLGYLHAGALVPRSNESIENEDCSEGWYAIRPRGFVCSERSVTLDLEHPTLSAMSMQPQLDAALPYTYARANDVTALFERTDNSSIQQVGRLGKHSTMAIVGSWTAPDESNEPQRLGMLMTGRFVRAADLRVAGASRFQGVHLSEAQALPVGFVVKRGVRIWALDGENATAGDELAYHQVLSLSGRFRTVDGERFYAAANDLWVRHKDVTVVLARHEMPDFVRDELRWVDISVITNTAVFYEGRRPVYVTLVSVGRDRLGDPAHTASTERGTFEVVAKHITRRDENPARDSGSAALYDLPWVLELSNGQLLHGVVHHDRFGIEHTDGNVHLAPQDAATLWRWATPELPEGWHSVRHERQPNGPKTLVHIRK